MLWEKYFTTIEVLIHSIFYTIYFTTNLFYSQKIFAKIKEVWSIRPISLENFGDTADKFFVLI